MHRRRFLEGVGIATVGAVAGCTDTIDGVTGGSGEPDLEAPEFEVNNDAPARPIVLVGTVESEDVQYGDEFSADIVIGNAGGAVVEEGTELTFLLEHRDGGNVESQERTVVVGGLGQGETKTVTAGPYDAAATGEWRVVPGPGFDRAHDEYDLSLAVDPVEIESGTEFELDTGLQLTVEGVEFEQTLHYETSESRGYWSSADVVALHPSLEDQVLGVVRLTVENAGSETIAFDNTGWGYDGIEVDSSQYEVTPNGIFGSIGDEPANHALIDGEELRSVRVDPGESTDAWLVTPVGVDETGELAFQFSVRADGTPAEYLVPIGEEDPALPSFEFVELDLPAERTGDEQELGMVIENTGDAAGTFRGVVEYSDGGSWHTAETPLEVDLEPGESGRVNTTTSGDQSYDYRVQPFGVEFEF